jgi:outer membrane protein OmpA-like peptidoglycan-associated protein
LGLRRAEALKRELVKAGIRSRRIVTMSLGERRQVDFAADPAAQARNRRVEILLDSPTLEKRRVHIESRLERYQFPTCE